MIVSTNIRLWLFFKWAEVKHDEQHSIIKKNIISDNPFHLIGHCLKRNRLECYEI